MRGIFWVALLSLCGGLSACGTYAPPLEEYHEGSNAAGNMVNAVMLNITCEVKDSLYEIIREDQADFDDKILPERLTNFLDSWGVRIALSFTIEEKGSATVGVTGLPPSPASAVASLAGGLTGSATATRIDAINAFHAVRDISRTRCLKGARPGGLFMMQSDLKLKEWLKINATLKGTELVQFPITNDGPFKQDVISHQIKFIIENTESFTPGWKITRALVNQGSEFLSASRTRTHDLTITLGPLDKSELKKGRIVPSRALENSALASDIGTSVRNNLGAGAQVRPSIFSILGF